MQPIEWDYFHCAGLEANLSECGRSRGYTCGHNEDASVICSYVSFFLYILVCEPFVSTGCPNDHMFPCKGDSPDDLLCISELQFCDSVSDCPDGSDEPSGCMKGTIRNRQYNAL